MKLEEKDLAALALCTLTINEELNKLLEIIKILNTEVKHLSEFLKLAE